MDDIEEFHGGYTKEIVYWYNRELEAWLVKLGDAWRGFHTNGSSQTITGVHPTHSVAAHDLIAEWEPWHTTLNESRSPYIEWFCGGLTSAAFNEVDRHVLEGHGDEAAIVEDGVEWDESANEGLGCAVHTHTTTRRGLFVESCTAAQALRSMGLAQGSRVTFVMTNHTDQIVWTEACKRLAVLYTATAPTISAQGLCDRVHDLGAAVVITDTTLLPVARDALRRYKQVQDDATEPISLSLFVTPTPMSIP